MYIENSILPSEGGVERVSWIVGEYLKSKGHDVFFAYNFVGSDDVADDHKIKYIKQWGTKKLITKFCKFVDANKIDIIVCQHQGSRAMLKCIKHLKRTRGCQIVFCVHTNPEYCIPQNNSLKHKIKRILYNVFLRQDVDKYVLLESYALYDKFLLLSPRYYDSFIKIFGVKPSYKLGYMHNPLSFAECLLPEEYEQKKKQVLIISRFVEAQKNLRAAFRIWKSLEERGYNGWELIIGGYGQDEEMLRSYVNEIGMIHYQWIGKVTKPIPLYKESSIFLMTSHFEGFCMSLIESLQLGCIPLVFDTFSAVHDIIVDGNNGFIIPPYREDIYADKLYQLMNDSDKRTKMIGNAVASCERFSIEKIGEQWISMFNELVSKR